MIDILLVEDESLVALALSRKLLALGHRVCGMAATGEKAVALAQATSPGLILMDIRLAGKMDGIEAVRNIRCFSKVPVIFMTGYSEKAIEEAALALQPAVFLTKPLEFNGLEAVIGGLTPPPAGSDPRAQASMKG